MSDGREALGRLPRMVNLPEELRNRPERRPGQAPSATLTLDAYGRLKAELEELTTVGREHISERIKVAREHGDIRENAEYDAAKNEQGLMEARIRRIQSMLRDPEIVEAPVDADEVTPGMLVRSTTTKTTRRICSRSTRKRGCKVRAP
jgi:hypothetical protein